MRHWGLWPQRLQAEWLERIRQRLLLAQPWRDRGLQRFLRDTQFPRGRYQNKFLLVFVRAQVRFPNKSRLTPFVHGLFGAGRISGSALGVSGSDSAFAWAAGGGIDANLSRNFAIRVAQADFLQSRVMNGSQNNFRFSTGIVLKFQDKISGTRVPKAGPFFLWFDRP